MKHFVHLVAMATFLFLHFHTQAQSCDPDLTLVEIDTPNDVCDIRLEINTDNTYCTEWRVDGELVLAGEGEHILTIIGCPYEGFNEICVDVFCCDTEELVFSDCSTYFLDCDDCPCDSEGLDLVTINYEKISDDDCIYAFSTDLDTTSGDFCVEWTYEGDVIGTEPYIELSFDCEDILEGHICLNIYCCETSELLYTVCDTFFGQCECPCLPIFGASLSQSTDDDCIHNFEVIGDLDGYCFRWILDGEIVLEGLDENTFTFIGSPETEGYHGLCVEIICCEDGSLLFEDCTCFTVDCSGPCHLPPSFNLAQLISIDGCTYNFNIPDDFGSNSYCVDWILDGELIASGEDLFDVTHTFECNGIHEICANLYCCNDPVASMEECLNIDVSCDDCPDPCNLPASVSLVQTVVDDFDGEGCKHKFMIDPSITLTPEMCVAWSLDGGPFMSSISPNSIDLHFNCMDSGEHNICVRILCCTDPSYYVEYCTPFIVDCCETNWFETLETASCLTRDFQNNWLSVTPTLENTHEGVLYEWFIDGESFSTQSSPSFAFQSEGDYTICLELSLCEADCGNQQNWTSSASCNLVQIRCTNENACPADFSNDGVINGTDLLFFLGQFGEACQGQD